MGHRELTSKDGRGIDKPSFEAIRYIESLPGQPTVKLGAWYIAKHHKKVPGTVRVNQETGLGFDCTVYAPKGHRTIYIHTSEAHRASLAEALKPLRDTPATDIVARQRRGELVQAELTAIETAAAILAAQADKGDKEEMTPVHTVTEATPAPPPAAPSVSAEPTYVNMRKAARQLGLTKARISALLREGKLSGRLVPGQGRAGRVWIVEAASLSDYIPRHRRAPKAPAPPKGPGRGGYRHGKRRTTTGPENLKQVAKPVAKPDESQLGRLLLEVHGIRRALEALVGWVTSPTTTQRS